MAPWHDGRTHGTGPELWVHWWKPTRHVSRGRNLDFCKFCGLFWSVCPKRSIRCFGTQPFMWASASRDTSNESQALMNDEHTSISWGLKKSIIQLLGSETITQELQGHSGISQVYHSMSQRHNKDLFFIEKSSKEWFGSDRQSMCFLKPLRCSTAISACATADLWKQSLQLFYVELIRLRPETWQKFGWGVNSTKLDLSSTSQSCTESSGNSAFKFFWDKCHWAARWAKDTIACNSAISGCSRSRQWQAGTFISQVPRIHGWPMSQLPTGSCRDAHGHATETFEDDAWTM